MFSANGELVKTLLDNEEFDAGYGRERLAGTVISSTGTVNVPLTRRPDAGTVVRTVRAVSWDGKNEAGKRVASGVYLYQLRTPESRSVRRMILTR